MNPLTPKSKDETVVEIIDGPDKEGKHTYFRHWLTDYFPGVPPPCEKNKGDVFVQGSWWHVRSQIFRTALPSKANCGEAKRKYRFVDQRYNPPDGTPADFTS